MEEVDSIILHFLKQLNMPIDDDVKNICDLSVDVIVESASRCLTTINKSLKVPSKLPSGISQKIEVAAQIASVCKDMGYKNDVGYQTFLYYNEAELRQVFMFLIERLPNESKKAPNNQVEVDSKTKYLQEIGAKIKEELNTLWIPPCCNLAKKWNTGDFNQTSAVIENTWYNKINCEDLIKKLVKITKGYPVKVLEKNSIGDTEGATQELEINSPVHLIDVHDNRSLKELKETAFTLRHKFDAYESSKNALEVEYSQVKKSYDKAETELRYIQEILREVDVNVANKNNNNIVTQLQEDIASLESINEELLSQIMALNIDIDKKKNKYLTECERTQCKQILNNLRESAKSMKNEYEIKKISKDQLIEAYGKLKIGNKRSNYTKRIMEIISNVDKQNMEIKKVLEDTRQLQKEINMLEGQLDRCFSIADETLYKDAKKDDQAKKAYKLLALLHSECNSIVSLVNETGILQRDIVDLEDNIESEKAKNTEGTLQQILLDHSRMQEESTGT